MPLSVFEETSPGVYTEISSDGAFINPILTMHNGQKSESIDKKLFIGRPSGDTFTYTNITIKPISTGGDNDVDGSTGWGVKLMSDSGSTPTKNDWDAVSYGNQITIPDISDDNKIAFWYHIESPSGIDVGSKRNVALLLQFTES